MPKSRINDVITPENIIRVRGWARDGLDNEQIAKNLGIVPSTLYTYALKNKELENALKKGKEVADREIENSLYKRALGYDVEEVIEEQRPDADGNMIITLKKKTKKHIPPDTTAIIYWLNNRKPKEWRNKQVIEGDARSVISNMQAMADLVNKPAKQRKIEDFEQ